jgi:DNA polymerase-3 subunit alpha
MEKETTGIYISGHPMDDYRIRLKGSHVVSIGSLMADGNPYRDEQIISVAGIVQSIKMKTTRSGSMMAYVTVEDDTATVEMLAFSNVLSQYGGYIRENEAVVVTGRLSLRDDKEPQIVVNRVRPISDFSPNEVDDVQEEEPVKVYTGMLYLRLATEDGPMFRKVKAILNMFPGESQVVVYFADTKLRRGTRCTLDSRMVNELKNVLTSRHIETEEKTWMPAFKKEAFKTSGQVQYVATAGNFVQKGYKYTGVLQILRTMMNYDYLWINIRVKGGAYGCKISSVCRFSRSLQTSRSDKDVA